MREQGLVRLSETKLGKNDHDYIVMKHLIEDLARVIPLYAKGKVLDIGCGNKPYELMFTGVSSSYTGCDVVQSSESKVDVICEAVNLKFEDAQFDTVFSTQVIEHVEDPFAMLAEANRVLKKDGLIIISAPFCWELHEQPYDFYRYSKYGLEAMFRKHDFEVLELKSNGGKWAAIFQMNLNIIYSTFAKKTFLRRIVKVLFLHLGMTRLFNVVGCWMDKKYYDDLLTLNYVIVGKKIV
ncbi:MAG: class I SAM-dependent methyltransferase [Sphingobacteriales bacterium]|nr:MAG: class I SAM-dependent methyltransferase [Sphingobacteriales bacterium]